jgi:hypothetical protein
MNAANYHVMCKYCIFSSIIDFIQFLLFLTRYYTPVFKTTYFFFLFPRFQNLYRRLSNSLDGRLAHCKASANTAQHKQKKCRHTSMPQVGFKPMNPTFEGGAKAIYTLRLCGHCVWLLSISVALNMVYNKNKTCMRSGIWLAHKLQACCWTMNLWTSAIFATSHHVTNSMEQSLWEANSSSATQIPWFLWNINCQAHKSLPSEPYLQSY